MRWKTVINAIRPFSAMAALSAYTVTDHSAEYALCWLPLINTFNFMRIRAPACPTDRGGEKDRRRRRPAAVKGSSLTGTGPLRVTVNILNSLLFFQSSLVQIFIQRSQQRVHVSLVRLQHQLCHTSEGLEEG